jgi:GT2 family glycosyltransferase
MDCFLAKDAAILTADILIPFFGKPDLLKRCLNSVKNSVSGRPHRILLVDDGSPAEDRRAVDRDLANLALPVDVITHDSNRGYKEAIGTGIRHCGHSLVILLNNDTVVTPDFDLKLLGPLGQAGRWTATAPVSNHPTDLYQYREALGDVEPGPSTDIFSMEAAAKRLYRAPPEIFTPAPYLTGMCLALDHEVFRRVGYFGGAYAHGYFEDLALCCEIRRTGYQLEIREDCFVYHQGHATYRDKAQTEKQAIIEHNLSVFEADWGHLSEHADLRRRMEYAGSVCPI